MYERKEVHQLDLIKAKVSIKFQNMKPLIWTGEAAKKLDAVGPLDYYRIRVT